MAELALAIAGLTVQPLGLLILVDCLIVGAMLIWRGLRESQTLPNPLAMILIGVAVIGAGVLGPFLGWW